MSNCIFCKIGTGEIPAEILYEDDQVVAFSDINPQAPVHFLVIPRKHIATLNEIEPAEEALIGHLYSVAGQLAARQGIAESGYRCVINCNEDAGQTVFHIHLHVLGGRAMNWPPG